MMIISWLSSQSWGEELESGEAICLPLLSQSALFVTRHRRLSRHRAPWPRTLLSILHPSVLPFPHTLSTFKGKHVTLLCSIGAKRALLPRGRSSLLLPIDVLNLCLQSSTYLSVFLSKHLAIWLWFLLPACVPLRTSKWLLVVINMLCGSVLGILIMNISASNVFLWLPALHACYLHYSSTHVNTPLLCYMIETLSILHTFTPPHTHTRTIDRSCAFIISLGLECLCEPQLAFDQHVSIFYSAA